MLKVFATQVVISRGYDNKPAISITKGNDSAASVRFRIGKKVYDPKAENNARWLNYSVKGFGPIVDRIEKMQLKEGSFINIEAVSYTHLLFTVRLIRTRYPAGEVPDNRLGTAGRYLPARESN